jgi:CDP-diacylglycerol--serine O-phosphatidyltransferase
MNHPTQRFADHLIIRLNPVDLLTLSGVLLCGVSLHLILNRRFDFALGILYLSVITDAFDGILARRFARTRNFGRYLDSFVDTLNYLLIPTIFLYVQGNDSALHAIGFLAIVCCGFIRLSVFNEIGNTEDEHKGASYLGVPVFWTVLPLGTVYLLGQSPIAALISGLLPIACLALAGLMLHKRNYHKFKSPTVILTFLLGNAGFFLAKGAGELTAVTAHVITALVVALPIIGAGTLHMLIVKHHWLQITAKPIWQAGFGTNKTYRGFIVMPVATAFFSCITALIIAPWTALMTFNPWQHNPATTGLLLGLAYALAELPNSWLKRRAGIAAGQAGRHPNIAFRLLDDLDSAIGCTLFYLFAMGMPLITALTLLLISPVVAAAVKGSLRRAGIKEDGEANHERKR